MRGTRAHPWYVWVTHLPVDKWAIGTAIMTFAALVVAIVMLALSRQALNESRKQTARLAGLNDQLQTALVRPLVRVATSARALRAIRDEQALREQWRTNRPRPPVLWLALHNLGPGQAVVVSVAVSGSRSVGFRGEPSLLAAPEDYLVLEVTMPNPLPHDHAVPLPLEVRYADILSHLYRYSCQLFIRDGRVVHIDEARDESVGD